MNPDLKAKLQPSIDAFLPVGQRAGGERTGAGLPNKPPGEHKKQIYVSLEQDFIDEWGGEKKLKADIKKFMYRELQKGKW